MSASFLKRSWSCLATLARSTGRPSSLRTKILLALLPTMVPMLAIVLHSYISGWRALRTSVGHLSRLAVCDGTAHLNDFLRLNREKFEQWIGEDNKDRYGLHIQLDSVAVAGVEFAGMLAGTPEFCLLALTDLDGRVLVAYARGRDPRFFLKGSDAPEARTSVGSQGREYFVDLAGTPFLARAGVPFGRTFVFGYPTHDTTGRRNGCLLAYVDWRYVSSKLGSIADRLHQSDLPNATVALVRRSSGEAIATVHPGHNVGHKLAPVLTERLAEWLSSAGSPGNMERFETRGQTDYVTFWPMHDGAALPRSGPMTFLSTPAQPEETPGVSAGTVAGGEVADSDFAVVAFIPESDFAGEAQRRLAFGLVLALVGCLATGGAIWYAGGTVAKRILLTVAKLRDVTDGVADLSKRMHVAGNDELGELAESMNSFLDRLQALMCELRESQERHRMVSELTSDYAYAFRIGEDGALVCEWVAGAFRKITGHSDQEITGRDAWLDLVHPDDRPIAASQLAAMTQGKSPVAEYRIITASGEVRRMVNYGRALRDGETGDVVRVYGAVQDVTERYDAQRERVQLQEQLRHTQRMEALGRLAGGVAHDFNNLLTGILGYANLLKLDAQPDDEVFEAADVIEHAAERAAELTKQLLGFARRGKLQNQALCVHSTIGNVVSLLCRTVDKRIVMAQRFGAAVPYVKGDPGQVEQVFMNLGVNAADAMPNGGELTFSTDTVILADEDCEPYLDMEPGEYLSVQVSDTGTGIPPELMERIFEPFFTTKEQGKGTGMGLAMVYGIVSNHGGTVRVSSRSGVGTTFTVLLPLCREGIPGPGAGGTESLVTGSGRILVVDDEEAVLSVVTAMLTRLGYQVVAAQDGLEAVEYYSDHKDRVDLVLIDMTMPVMNGSDCYRELRHLNPDIKALLSTGHALEGSAQELLDEGMQGFIQKPYVAASLSQQVARVLGGPRAQSSEGSMVCREST